jgi:hypothetical protein
LNTSLGEVTFDGFCVLQTGVPALLAATEKGCREYTDYLKQKKPAETGKMKKSPSSLVDVASR